MKITEIFRFKKKKLLIYEIIGIINLYWRIWRHRMNSTKTGLLSKGGTKKCLRKENTLFTDTTESVTAVLPVQN